MAQFQIPNPWQAGYAVPAYSQADPPGQREAIVSEGLPRGTYNESPKLWAGGFTSPYAVPDYVEAEPLRRGAMNAYGLQRKTVSSLVPDYLSGVEQDDLPAPGFAGDTIKAYGEKGAAIILADLAKVPAGSRAEVLKVILSALEPGLPDRVTTRMTKYKAAGMDDVTALRTALASSMSEGFARELIKLGKGGTPAPMVSLGMMGMDGFWSTVKSIVTAPVKGVQKAASFTVGKLGSLACKVLSNPASEFAGAAAGAVIGGPAGVQAGAAGASIGKTACAKPPPPPPPTPLQALAASMPSWAIPAAIGGVGLLAVVLLTRK